MTTTLSRNLKLRINSNLTADAKYNLERLDVLASTYQVDSTDTLKVRSVTDILLEPESADVGGSGVGGTLSVGTAAHALSSIQLHSPQTLLDGQLGLLDRASGGTKSLLLQYKSDANGVVDTAADRQLTVDLEGANRTVILGGDLTLTGGSLSLTVPGSAVLTAPASGTLATLAGNETLTNKSIDATQNVLTNISNTSIATNAAIAYSKLNLTGSLVNADVASGANISYSKLALSSSITDSDIFSNAAITRSKIATGNASWVLINSPSGGFSEEPYLSKTRGGSGQDQTNVTYPTTGTLVTEAGIETLTNKSIDGLANTLTNVSPSSINLANYITNAMISTSAGIVYSKLNLSGGIVDADISSSASISRSKIAAGTPTTIVVNDGSGNLATLASLDIARGGTGSTSANGAVNNLLPAQTGLAGRVLQTDGSNTSWAAVGTGSVTSVALTAPAEFSVAGSPITTTGTLAITKATQSANSVWAGPITGSAATPAFRALVLADLPTSIPYSSLVLTGSIHDSDVSNTAAIGVSKLAALTSNKALVSDGSGVISASSVTATELGYVSGLSSALQTQLDGKQPLDSDLTAVAGLATTGLIVRTGTGSAATRTLVAGAGVSLTNASGVAGDITVASTITQYSDEAAQDAVASALTNTTSVAWTYNDAANTISAAVLPSGVDHDSLLNYVANKHVDHTSVSISTAVNSGLSGGGTIASTRTLATDPTNAPTVAPASGDLILFADISNSNSLSKTTLQTILDLGGGKVTATWITSDGVSKAVTHSLGTTDVSVDVYDIDTGADVSVDSVVRTDSNTVTLTASSAPAGSGLKVIIRK